MNDTPTTVAHVQKLVPGDYPVGIDQVRFFVVPRIGETIHIMEGDEEITLRVVGVDHWAHGDNDIPNHITITGSEID